GIRYFHVTGVQTCALPIYIFGHEFMGIVEDVGPEVSSVKKGDRVIIPFVIACGHCFFCEHELMAACENTNSGQGAILNKKQIPRSEERRVGKECRSRK